MKAVERIFGHAGAVLSDLAEQALSELRGAHYHIMDTQHFRELRLAEHARGTAHIGPRRLICLGTSGGFRRA